MTTTELHTPLPMTRRHNHSDTIYLDHPFATPDTLSTWRSFPRAQAQAQPDETVSNGIFLGLAALLLPTVVYSFAQMWSLVSGGTLEHAIRAFLP